MINRVNVLMMAIAFMLVTGNVSAQVTGAATAAESKSDATKVEILVGEKYSLKVAEEKPATATADAKSTTTWTSNNTKAVTVDRNGVIKGVAEGRATVTATVKDGANKSAKPKEVKWEVTVLPKDKDPNARSSKN